MRTALLLCTALVATNAAAAKSPLSKFGVPQGDYCSKDGLRVGIGPNTVYIGMVLCNNPTVSAGKIRSNTCESTAGNPVILDETFEVKGDAIISDGTTYTLTPERPGALPCEPAQAAASTTPPANATADSGWSTWQHNGSYMLVNEKVGRIIYEEPKALIAGTIKKGDVLFEGTFSGKTVSGTAFVFKKGCAPAPYAVSGRMESHSGGSRIVLSGPAPKRDKNSCAIVGTTSTHSRLVFEEYGDI